MKTLLNEYVKHDKFGRGLIIEEHEGRIKVNFISQKEVKIFQFPDAFENFLAFENELLEKESLRFMEAKKQQKEENKKRNMKFILEYGKRQEEIRKEKLKAMKKKKSVKNKAYPCVG